MSILLRIERESGGQPIELGDGQITGYSYINTSPADFFAKAYNAEHSIQIRGEIPLRLLPPVEQDADNSNTLYAWALTEYRPDNDYYRTVTVRIVRHEKTIREVKFTYACVHAYQEQVNGMKGVLEFELVVRQRQDQLDSIQFGTAESMQQKFKKEKRDHVTILSGASKIEFAESTRSIRYAYAEEAFGIEGGSSSDSSQTWCRATIDGRTYSHAAPCDNPNHCVKIPKGLQEILDNPVDRITYVDEFFKKYQGKHYPNPSTKEIKINFGKDIVGFMEWELNSTRIAKSTGSAYWKSVNAQMIADIYWAQQAFITKPGTKQEEIWSEYEIRWKKFMSTPNQDLLWKAHNGSIFYGHDLAIKNGLLAKEEAAEQQFIRNVIFRVSLMEQEVNKIADVPSFLGTINYLMDSEAFEYPKHYPATFDDSATKPFWDVEDWVPQYLRDLAPR